MTGLHDSAGNEAPPTSDPSRTTVWVCHGSTDLMDHITTMLQSLDVDVRSWRAVAPKPCRGGLAPGALRRVREHIDARLSETLSLAELAAVAGLSECHFSRAFKQSLLMSPHRYVVARRVAFASELIAHTARPLTDIALAAGFSDHSHFTRTFVRVTGVTPRAFRRDHR